jgi:AraC-like DNA-binding protein
VFGYLRELRMLKAKKLLLAEKDSVTHVSGEVGYQYPHHFSTAFKKRFGVLPAALCKY